MSKALPTAIVALGVWGEIRFGGRARHAADELQDILDQKVAESNARAAEANEKAEQERLARVQIEARLTPRSLTPEQQERIAERLSTWAILPGTDKRQSVAVFPTSRLFESASLAEQITAALTAAGWDVSRNEVTFGKSISAKGVWLLTSRNPRAIAIVESLIVTLFAEGILTFWLHEPREGCEEMGHSKEQIDENPWCSQISVFVGDHP